jgi:hypothetical protein
MTKISLNSGKRRGDELLEKYKILLLDNRLYGDSEMYSKFVESIEKMERELIKGKLRFLIDRSAEKTLIS